MPKAWASLHTARPTGGQLEHEVNYEGYARVEVDYDDDFAKGATVTLEWPIVEKSSLDVVHFIAIGAHEKGQGEVLLIIQREPALPLVDAPERRNPQWWFDNAPLKGMTITMEQAEEMVKAAGYNAPRIELKCMPAAEVVDDLHPIAKAAWKLTNNGLLLTSEIHPKLFEAINDELQKHGMPILTVTRDAAAKMNVNIKDLKISL